MVVGAGLLRHVGAFPLADMSASGKAGTCPTQSKKSLKISRVRALRQILWTIIAKFSEEGPGKSKMTREELTITQMRTLLADTHLKKQK